MGQQGLDFEKNKLYEVGGKWDLFNGDLLVSLVLFQIIKDNVCIQIDSMMYMLVGKICVCGVCLGVMGYVIDKLQIFVGYMYLDVQIVNGIVVGMQGMMLVNMFKYLVIVWMSYVFVLNWEVGVGVFYMFQWYVNNINIVQMGGFVCWDVMLVYYQLKYDVWLNLFNVFNKMYYDVLILFDGGCVVLGIGCVVMFLVVYWM